jgi:glycerate kinase
MHILIAPNAFKNSLDAPAVALAIQRGLEQSSLSCSSTCFPIADGGDGTGALIIEHLKGTTVCTTVKDPLGRDIESRFGIIHNGNTAVIEMADASGLRLLKTSEYSPLTSSSFGTGQLILKALDYGVNKIILAIGGSASIDGGTGLLSALGVRFLDIAGNNLEQIPKNLIALSSIDASQLDKRLLNCRLMILCDVENTLLGEKGAATVFGPQKGATLTDITTLEASLTQFRNIVLKQTGTDIALLKHGGAAGGTAAGVAGLLGAALLKGIDYFLELTNFAETIQTADLLITGEGCIDLQTLEGKAPMGVAIVAKKNKIPVIGIAGKIAIDNLEQLREFFNALVPIVNEPFSLEKAFRQTEHNLVRTGNMIGEILAMQCK